MATAAVLSIAVPPTRLQVFRFALSRLYELLTGCADAM